MKPKKEVKTDFNKKTTGDPKKFLKINKPLISAEKEPRKPSLFERAAAHKSIKLKRKKYEAIGDGDASSEDNQ